MPSSRETEERHRGVEQQRPLTGESDPREDERTNAGQASPDETGEQPDRDRVQELEAEVARFDDRYRRALADLDNYRKRSARETERRVAEERERLQVIVSRRSREER